MDKLRSKIRRIIQEDLNIVSGNTPPRFSVKGAINKLLKQVMQRFETQLNSAYDIEFEDAYHQSSQIKVNFQVYNRRSDLMKDGMILIYEVNQKIKLEIRGGQIGGSGLQDKIYEEEFAPSEDILENVDIVSVFRTIAGR